MYSDNSTCNIKISNKSENDKFLSFDNVKSVEERIESIKKNIENGTYFVDTNKLALSLLGNIPTLFSSSNEDNLNL